MPFQYKRVLLVGATSGIGKDLAERFVKEGIFVIAVGRRKENLQEFVERVGNDKAAAVPFDVSEIDQIPNFVQNVTLTYPDMDCVFLNSGMQRTFDFSKPEKIDMSLFSHELLTNYTSFVTMTQAFLPFLLKQSHETCLLYTTSNLAIVPLVRAPGYSGSKAALHAFVLCLRAQLQGTKVKVVELLPPLVQTEIHNAKNQPDIKDGEKQGMPLSEFTDLAFQGLEERERDPSNWCEYTVH